MAAAAPRDVEGEDPPQTAVHGRGFMNWVSLLRMKARGLSLPRGRGRLSHRFFAQAKSHPRTVYSLLALVVCAVIIIAVTVPVCTVLGCPRKPTASSQVSCQPCK